MLSIRIFPAYRMNPEWGSESDFYCTELLDACKFNNGGCDDNAQCDVMDYGMPVCTCQPGYTGDGTTCQSTCDNGYNGDCPSKAKCSLSEVCYCCLDTFIKIINFFIMATFQFSQCFQTLTMFVRTSMVSCIGFPVAGVRSQFERGDIISELNCILFFISFSSNATYV